MEPRQLQHQQTFLRFFRLLVEFSCKCFHAINIPLLLVSSQKPLEDEGANGLINFHIACLYIQKQQTAGVFVPYKNDNELALIHQASQITQSFQLSSRFESCNNQAYMQFDNESLSLTSLTLSLSFLNSDMYIKMERME